ncbi:hypothetical protein EX30DRAFT_27199 [Ascodesmis nigricans]|uniref:Uncharacterized protein n=1 Tax=Ascodesmis nigricans TaxID=341454 RepID=A0A4S2N854_9PEZI|nr:hypothetical protein EX30DRAFT_27199 [Ascodesmis nigricans]
MTGNKSTCALVVGCSLQPAEFRSATDLVEPCDYNVFLNVASQFHFQPSIVTFQDTASDGDVVAQPHAHSTCPETLSDGCNTMATLRAVGLGRHRRQPRAGRSVAQRLSHCLPPSSTATGRRSREGCSRLSPSLFFSRPRLVPSPRSGFQVMRWN